MKYYDARIIEGCCVFSYNVEGPQNVKNTKRHKKTAGKNKKQETLLQKMLLRFVLLLLAPFAFVADLSVVCAKMIAKCFRSVVRECSRASEIAACILVAISSTALIPLIFLFL